MQTLGFIFLGALFLLCFFIFIVIIIASKPSRSIDEILEQTERDLNEENKNVIEFKFARQRHGTTGELRLFKSDRWSTIYENRGQYERDNIDDVP